MVRACSWFSCMVRMMVLGLLLSLAACPALAQGVKKSDAVVKVEATASRPGQDGTQDVTIQLTIDRGWHLYANPVGNEDLLSSQTSVAATGARLVKVRYPEGKVIKDKVLGEYRTYEDRATIQAVIQRVPGSTTPAKVTVKFTACDANRCLPPSSVELTIPEK